MIQTFRLADNLLFENCLLIASISFYLATERMIK